MVILKVYSLYLESNVKFSDGKKDSTASINHEGYPANYSICVIKAIIIALQYRSLTYLDPTYPDYSLIRTHPEPIPIPQQKMPHISGNSVIRTFSLGTKVFG